MSPQIWPLIDEESILTTPIFEVRRNTCRSPKDGRDKGFFVLEVPDWVQVLAFTSGGNLLLVRQYRQGTRDLSLELPGGVVETGRESLLEAAQRELREETGYTAEQWIHLASFRPNPAIQSNQAHVFLAEKASLAGPVEFDENEDLELVLTPRDSLRGLLSSGKINHAIMVAAIGYYLAVRP